MKGSMKHLSAIKGHYFALNSFQTCHPVSIEGKRAIEFLWELAVSLKTSLQSKASSKAAQHFPGK